MDGWMDGWWMDGLMDGWTDGRMDGWMEGGKKGWIEGVSLILLTLCKLLTIYAEANLAISPNRVQA
jgi:hypothetical protein